MSQSSHILGLPYIQPAQAQKHVTHNEAIRALDTLVQLSVADRTQTTPPPNPVSGDRHIVATGGTDDWANQDDAIAVFEDAAWAFYPPQAGWQAVVRAEGVALIWDGTAWTASAIDPSAFQNLSTLGVNTTADTTNRLAVSADATLLNHAGSDHRVVVNKDTAADTASLLFQTGFSGRAEMGTAGTDNFEVKVSADAATWNTGLKLDAATGCAEFPAGAKVPARAEMGGRISCFTDNRWVTHNSFYGVSHDSLATNAGTGTDPALSWSDMGALVDKDSQLRSVLIALRSNSTQVTGFDARLYFQTGTWTTGWGSNADTTRTLVGSIIGANVGSEFYRNRIDFGSFDVPDDGFLTLFIRPIGTVTATRYLYSSIILSYLTPS